MDRGRAILIVLHPAHKALADALVDHENNLRCNLCSEEHGFLHAVATAWGTRPSCGSSARGIGVALLLPLGEVFRGSQSLDRCGGLRVSRRAVMRHGRVHGGSAGHGVVGMGGCDEQRIHTVTRRVIHRTSLAGRCRSVGSSGGKGSREVGGDFGGEHSGGWGENVLLCDCAQQGLCEAYE